MLLRKKWTFLCALWEKVNYFCQNMSKIVDCFGHFGPMGGGVLSHHSHPPGYGPETIPSYQQDYTNIVVMVVPITG